MAQRFIRMIYACPASQFAVCASSEVDVSYWKTYETESKHIEYYKISCYCRRKKAIYPYKKYMAEVLKIIEEEDEGSD